MLTRDAASEVLAMLRNEFIFCTATGGGAVEVVPVVPIKNNNNVNEIRQTLFYKKKLFQRPFINENFIDI